LGGNVAEHSKSEGIVAAVVHRARRTQSYVHFAIGDAGIGLRKSFLDGAAPHHPNSDHEAITLALQYLVSSVADDPGRGQGIFTTIEQTLGLQGTAAIRSGAAIRRLERGKHWNQQELHRSGRALSVQQLEGTVVAVTIPCK